MGQVTVQHFISTNKLDIDDPQSVHQVKNKGFLLMAGDAVIGTVWGAVEDAVCVADEVKRLVVLIYVAV
mgnify:FL=1